MKNTSWIRGTRFVVVGLGMTGIACCEALCKLDAEVIATDTRDDLHALVAQVEKAEAAGAVVMKKEAAMPLGPEAVVVSPGVSRFHPLVAHFEAAGAEIISEIELAYRLAEGTMIAITGTNGKTTTTGLTGAVMSSCFHDVRVAGNIGEPLLSEALSSSEDTLFVVEVSSYQLEACPTFRGKVAVELNVQPDHLERHGTMKGYAAAKRRLVENLDEGDFALLNFDDMFVREMSSHTAAKVMWLSAGGRVECGGFVEGGRLFARVDGTDAAIGDAAKMMLFGRHNRLNALAAGVAGVVMGVPAAKVAECIHGFKGFPHRIQKVGVVDGIEYVNDSKATNVDSTYAALEAFRGRGVVLILGGDDKGLDYSGLYEEVKRNVKAVVVLGTGLRRMVGELKAAGYDAVEAAEDMAEAVRAASRQAAGGDVVLLSPASSSFDLFRNFEHRGECFADAVKCHGQKRQGGSGTRG